MNRKQPIDGTERVRFNSVFNTHPIMRRDILSQLQGPDSPRRLVITKESTVIGRSPETDIQLCSNLVSRQHVQLIREGTELVCKDLNSHNGLLINGIKVYSAALRDGDTIQIGDVVLLYHKGVQWTSS